MLKIRLVDLHPIFKEIDLCANPQLKLCLRINTGRVAISGILVGTGATQSSQIKLDSTTMTSGQTCPIMIASAAAGNPMAGMLATGNQITFAFGAMGNDFTPTAEAAGYFPYQTSRLHIPFYHLKNPTSIIQKPVKKIRYLDCYAQMFR